MILIFITDQLTRRALPAYGNTYANPPNIDRIARNALLYDECYTSCPLCQPSRASFRSGIYPHETKVYSNDYGTPILPEEFPTVGSTFTEHGYTAVHFGKTHDSGALRGFQCAPVNRMDRQRSGVAPLLHGTYGVCPSSGQKSALYFFWSTGNESGPWNGFRYYGRGPAENYEDMHCHTATR